MTVKLSLVFFLCSAALLSSCKKPEKPVDRAAIEVSKFIPKGWIVEFDTVAPILDAGRTAHVMILEEYDSAAHRSGARMLSIVGADATGKWQRFAANKNLFQTKDLSTDAYVPSIANTLKIKKDVISIVTHTSGVSNASYAAKEEFKIRYDKATQRFKLIGYDLTDVTDGVTTIDSRNYPTRNRLIESREGKDTLFHRLVKLRHTGPFLEDLQPFQLAVAPEQMKVENEYVPETVSESATTYDYGPADPIDSSAGDPNSVQL